MAEPAPEPSDGADQSAPKPHYHGHRQRLRERFLGSGPDSLADYELLELLLFSAKPRQDVKPLAKALIARFGGFAGVLHADIAALGAVPGLGETSATLLKAVEASMTRALREEVRKRPVLSSWQKLLDYCSASMGHAKIESFRLLFLDRQNGLIADEVQQTGTVDHTPVYPREVAKAAAPLGLQLHDHLIIGRGGKHASLKSLGLI